MSEQVTLSIPDHNYRRAQRLAEESRQHLNEALTEILQRALPPYHVSRQHLEMEREKAAFVKLLPTLKEKHSGQYVALKDGTVVDHGPNLIALVTRVAATYPQDLVPVKLVTEKPLRILRAPSPRLR